MLLLLEGSAALLLCSCRCRCVCVGPSSSPTQAAPQCDQCLCVVPAVCDQVVIKGNGPVAKDGGHDAATKPKHSHLIALQQP
jgi:hypothetical protein